MKPIFYLKLMTFLLCCWVSNSLFAQDIHWSQFYNSPLNLNPALTGMFNGDARFAGNYRSQWNKVPVNYLTFSGSYEKRFSSRSLQGAQIGGGLLLNYDRAGDSKLSTAELGLVGSYIKPINNNNLISIGLQISGAQRSFDLAALTFDNQWDGEQFNGNLGTGENFDRTGFFVTDFTIGANWRTQSGSDKRTKIDIGVMLDHFVQPKQRFYTNDSESFLYRKIMLYGDGSIRVAAPVDLVLHGLAAWQGPYQEYVAGAGAKIYFNKLGADERALQLGVNFRLQDAFIPTIEYFHGAWRVGLSYDVNTSPFRVATRQFGGPELSVSYRILNVAPLPYKPCPIF